MLTIDTDKIKLEIPQGQIIGLFGENGAGKTTLIKQIFGFRRAKGTILLDGERITKRNIARLGYASCENSFFPHMSAVEHCKLYEEQFENFNRKRCEELMKFFDIYKYRFRPLKDFSTGQKNQFEIIFALSQGADYIFLDEPFTGNDIFNRDDFYKVLLGLISDNETIVLSTHLIEETNNFIDRLLVMKDGEIIADKTIDEIDEMGIMADEYVKKVYNYQEDRVSRALKKLMD